MKKMTRNLIVDLTGLIVFSSLTFTGVLLKYVLPPGSGGRFWRPGSGMDGNEVKTFFTMTRHQWGDVHFYLSIALIAFVLLHLFMHFKWLRAYLRNLRK